MKTHRQSTPIALVICAVAFAACGSGAGSPTAPSGAGPQSGTWLGTITDLNNVVGTLRLTIDERRIDGSRSLVSGSWSATFQDASRNGAGTLGGTITGATGTLLLTPVAPPACASGPFASVIGSYSAPQLAISSAAIQGPYSQSTCTGSLTGTLTLSKQ
ncbi:MAG: hypothetical protein KA371_01810 [Acidobacteria bacterium]|nr:hypothetical protein [Acidobacteriota bacterium]